MVDITKLDAEGIKNLSLEDMQEALLKGGEELGKARGVIATLNKEKKTGDNTNTGDDAPTGVSKEELDHFYKEKEQEKQLDAFIAENPQFEEKKDRIAELQKGGLSLDEAKGAILASDQTFANNTHTNQSGVGLGYPGHQSGFTGKIDYATYEGMSDEEKAGYEKYCEENHDGLDFNYSAEQDLD